MSENTGELEYLPEHEWIKECDYRVIRTIEEWEAWKKPFPEILSFDIETEGLNPEKHRIAGFVFCKEPGKAIYIPLNHVGNNFENVEYLLKDLQEIFKKVTVLAYNAKFDVNFVKVVYGLEIPNFEDVQISVHMDFPDALKKGLKQATDKLIGKKQIELKELFNPKGPYYSVFHPPGEERPKRSVKVSHKDFCSLYPEGYPCMYACSDADMTLQVYRMTEKERLTQKGIYDIENKLIKLVLAVENNRVMLDADYYCRLIRLIYQKLLLLEERIFEQTGKYNILSNPQTAEILVSMGVPLEKNEKGNYVTDKKALALFSEKFPILKEILLYRQYVKAIGGYLLKLYMGGLDTRGVKFRFNQVATATGRFSSSGKDKTEGDANTSAKDQDSDFIAVNAQNITGNAEAEWFKGKRIMRRRLKDTGEECYKYEVARLTEEEIELFTNLKDRLKEPKVSKRKTKKEDLLLEEVL